MADPDLEAEKLRQREKASQLFAQYDADESGTLDKDEVKLLLVSQGLSVSLEYLDGLLEIFDANKDGVFDQEEFATLAKVVIGRSVESANDLESEWFWRGLSFRYREGEGQPESGHVDAAGLRDLITAGTVTPATELTASTGPDEWEPWSPLSEWIDAWFPDAFSVNYLHVKDAATTDGGGDNTTPTNGPDAARIHCVDNAGNTPRSTARALSRALFLKYDADGSGSLDREEVKQVRLTDTLSLSSQVERCHPSVHGWGQALLLLAHAARIALAGSGYGDGAVHGGRLRRRRARCIRHRWGRRDGHQRVRSAVHGTPN